MAPIVVHAQFSKGDAFLGGTLSGSYSDFSSAKNPMGLNYYVRSIYSYSISPTLGFFTSKRFALGGTISVGGSGTEIGPDTNMQKNYTTNGSVAVMGRYFFPLSEKFMFALTADVFYSRSKDDNANGDGSRSIDKSYSTGLHVKPTLLFFPSRRWGFEASVGSVQFVHDQSLTKDVKTDNFNATFGAVSLGVAYYFRKS